MTKQQHVTFGFLEIVAGVVCIAPWLGCIGSDGHDGEMGNAGSSCTAADNGDGTHTVTCEDGTEFVVEDGESGEAGSSCSAKDNGDGTATITCEDSTSVTISNGESCVVTDNMDGTYTLSCGDGTEIIVSDGTSCSALDNDDGTYTLACGDGTEVTVSDGTSCVAADNDNGTYTLTCGTTDVTVSDGASCAVVDNLDETYTLTCGTEDVTVSNGEPCGVTGDGFGTFTITCGDDSETTFTVGDRPSPTLTGHVEHGHILAYDVQAAYNDDTFFWRLSYRGNRGDHHDYLRYTDGAWRKEGGDRRDAQSTLDADEQQGETSLNSTIYEQRTSIMISNPSAETYATNFDKFGCFLTCHDQARHMPEWEDSHGEDTKWIDPSLVTGSGTKPLDLWHWRGARSGPISRADDQYIASMIFADTTTDDNGGRKGDSGNAVFKTNNLTNGSPDYVFDPSTTLGLYAFNWDDFWATPFYYITDFEGTAASLGPYAPNPGAITWASATSLGYSPFEGDTVPRRILRAGSGSRADIMAFGSEFIPESPDGQFGTWRVQMQRALNTGNDDDVVLAEGNTYYAGFEVHLWEYTTRDHYVSFPTSVALGAAADITAVKVDGSGVFPLAEFDDVTSYPPKRLYLFQPGISTWEFLTGADTAKTFIDPETELAVDQTHGGSSAVNGGTGCSTCHYVRASQGTLAGPPMETATAGRGGVFAATPVPVP